VGVLEIIELAMLAIVPPLAAGAAWMLRWKYRVDTADAETFARLAALEAGRGKAGEAEERMQEMRVMIARDYVTRADYVLHMSSLDAKISAIGAGVMRLEERSRGWGTRP